MTKLKSCEIMNVLVLHDIYGGSVKVYADIVKEQFQRLGVKVTVASTLPSRGKSQITLQANKGIRITFNHNFKKQLEMLKKDFGIELIHVNVFNSPYAFTIPRIAQKLRLPYVAQLHTYIHLCPIEYFVRLPELKPCTKPFMNKHCIKCMISKNKLLSKSFKENMLFLLASPYNMYSFRYLLKKASSIISPSKKYCTLLWNYYGIHASYLPNPIDPLFLKEKPESEGNGDIAFVGRLVWEKGLYAILKLSKAKRNIKIHIFGGHQLLSHKPPNVVLHGWIEDRINLIKLMKHVSILVLPSLSNEMFGNVVSEAFALGKPVVAFDLGGPKEQIESSGGGLLAKLYDTDDFIRKVNYLLENPYEAKEMGLRGRRWIEKNLNPKDYVRNLNMVYSLALERYAKH